MSSEMSVEMIITIVSVGVAGFSVGRMWTQKQMKELFYEVLRYVEDLPKENRDGNN
ncbi:hypothetical protein NHG32_07090 [Aerococcaceae bacterium NML191219]|nr:hypothetical protein [Aerococcaceae bacterium NML191219]